MTLTRSSAGSTSRIWSGAPSNAGPWAIRPMPRRPARGYMTEGLGLVLQFAFGRLELHRLEANIQPDNTSSLNLVKRLVPAYGFRCRARYARRTQVRMLSASTRQHASTTHAELSAESGRPRIAADPDV
ncbi:GNAT family N-acetyltransferase [Streptomyces sp. NPDC051956]|uniref:GNAT family N-acetyltransferase n=1 Tax=Streptomyces sp. NPDC051956 TaxID=3365677 RepID=UPI0037D7A782